MVGLWSPMRVANVINSVWRSKILIIAFNITFAVEALLIYSKGSRKSEIQITARSSYYLWSMPSSSHHQLLEYLPQYIEECHESSTWEYSFAFMCGSSSLIGFNFHRVPSAFHSSKSQQWQPLVLRFPPTYEYKLNQRLVLNNLFGFPKWATDTHHHCNFHRVGLSLILSQPVVVNSFFKGFVPQKHPPTTRTDIPWLQRGWADCQENYPPT